MYHAYTRGALVTLTILGIALNGAKLLADWIGRATLLDDATFAEQLLYQLASFLVRTPWWALMGSAVMLALATAHVYRVTYSREVVIKSDNRIVDLRSAAEIVLDTSRGGNFLIRPTQNVTIVPPKDGAEGIFRVFILNGDQEYSVQFSDEFEYVGKINRKVKRSPNVMYEVQVVGIRSGRGYRYFVSDNMALLDQANAQAMASALMFS